METYISLNAVIIEIRYNKSYDGEKCHNGRYILH